MRINQETGEVSPFEQDSDILVVPEQILVDLVHRIFKKTKSENIDT